MGAKTVQAERRVVEQRARIAEMLDDLERRVGADVEGVRHDVSERVSGISARATGAAQRVPGAENLTSQVTEHPLVSLLGGFGAGVALGMASGGADVDGPPSPLAEPVSRGQRDGHAGGFVGAISSVAIGAMAGPLRQEMQTLVRQAASGFLGTEPRDEPRAGTQAASASPPPLREASSPEAQPSSAPERT
ncbi:MAG: hypothetical protein EPO16_00650 [Dehalococcoidia bacterium]|nr:MAG: hypothetical protein EPO16_00650 [Dehalococcoidia bacterium]